MVKNISAKQEPDMMVTHELKFILLPQLINNYARSLPPLTNVNWSAFLECFMVTTGEMVPKEGSNLTVGT